MALGKSRAESTVEACPPAKEVSDEVLVRFPTWAALVVARALARALPRLEGREPCGEWSREARRSPRGPLFTGHGWSGPHSPQRVHRARAAVLAATTERRHGRRGLAGGRDPDAERRRLRDLAGDAEERGWKLPPAIARGLPSRPRLPARRDDPQADRGLRAQRPDRGSPAVGRGARAARDARARAAEREDTLHPGRA